MTKSVLCIGATREDAEDFLGLRDATTKQTLEVPDALWNPEDKYVAWCFGMDTGWPAQGLQWFDGIILTRAAMAGPFDAAWLPDLLRDHLEKGGWHWVQQ